MKMNKTRKKESCRNILNSYDLHSKITDQGDIDFLISIFEGHPERDKKKGSGVISISIAKSTYGTRYFQLNRTDGTSTDISFPSCISNKSKKSEIKSACRDAIKSEIFSFRDKNVYFGVSKCPFTGEILTKENTHIDHYDLTFDEVFKLWIKDQDIDYLYSKINSTDDNSYVTCFVDDNIIKGFIEFHNGNTSLRAVSEGANLSIIK